MRRQLALVLLSTLLGCGGGPNVAPDAGGVDARRCDEDGDGVSSPACGGPDCDDGSATVHPGAPERCNGLDDDCDGRVDEDLTEIFYTDADGDGHGNPSISRAGCDAPADFVASSDDCDDSNDGVYPGATEICNGLDDDCDGRVDEDLTDRRGRRRFRRQLRHRGDLLSARRLRAPRRRLRRRRGARVPRRGRDVRRSRQQLQRRGRRGDRGRLVR
ncbi:MAG: hypothetical protein GXP55_20710 [Deltaproteobacteria bacterium]|nr:hypothetical protein [Deltaproteobacteria bacterium]